LADRRARTTSLVIQTSFLGDVVLTTPLIAELARRGPVDVVATPAGAGLLANNPDVRDVVVFDKRAGARGLRGLWRTARSLRFRRTADDRVERRGAQTAYLAQGSLRSAALAALAGVPERVGFSTSAGRRLYTRLVPYHDDLHHAERLWRLAAEPDARPTAAALRPRLYPGAAERAAVDRLTHGAGFNGQPFAALAPGSAWATKRWPHYGQLARLLCERMPVVIIGGAEDAGLAREIMTSAGDRVVDATGQLTLLASAELIGRAAVIVTNDSAPLHLASAMGTPTVAIFGPTVPEFGFGPLAPAASIAGVPTLPCRPCHRHGPRHCPLGHWRCMRELGPEDLAQRVRALISIETS
jgi:heptosyltransferase II